MAEMQLPAMIETGGFGGMGAGLGGLPSEPGTSPAAHIPSFNQKFIYKLFCL